ncbi:hypothetical protein MMC17_000660 [Xylographa soralifera]|nr:hypothetical protein [Xylographa soralifera]
MLVWGRDMTRAWMLLSVASIGIGIATCAPILNDFRNVKFTVLKRQPLCAVDGNPDFYGLGIRIGIYLQWVTAFLSNHLLREAIDSNLITNTIFLLALFVATAVATADDTVQTSELVVLLHLCSGFLFSILSIWGHRIGTADESNEKIRFPLIGSFLRLTLATALSAYGVWFWFVGRPFHQPAGDCASYTFLFARLDIAGDVRYFFGIQSCLILVVYAILFAREFLMIIAFSFLVCAETIVIAALGVWFGPPVTIAEDEDRRTQSISAMNEELSSEEPRKLPWRFLSNAVKQWLRLSLAMGWKWANGKQSAGSNRPQLKFYIIPIIDVWIFLFRTWVEFWCLVLFKRSPKIDFMPLIPHPLWKSATKSETKWKMSMVQMQEHYNSKYTQQVIYVSNFICIIWTLISVELTLLWNDIRGVYTLDSTGQLIPFIIGMKVLDVPENASSHPSILETKDHESKETIFSLNATQQTVFWIREPHERSGSVCVKNKRNHSINSIHPWHIQDDVPGIHNDADSLCDQYHLKYLDNYRALREAYAKDSIEIYSPKDCKIGNFFIVKDFRKYEDKTIVSS